MKELILIFAIGLIHLSQVAVAQGNLDRVSKTRLGSGAVVDQQTDGERDLVFLPSRSRSRFFPVLGGFFDRCRDIVELVCSSREFRILCTAIEEADLEDALSTDTVGLTIFAPTDEAFENLGVDTLDAVLANTRVLENILLFHVVTDVLEFDDLECTDTIEMANGEDSRTVCSGARVFQKGAGNPRSNLPEIIDEDNETCQGFLHVVDEVLLPASIAVADEDEDEDEDEDDEDDGCRTITERICGNSNFSTLCSALEVAGLDDALDGTDQLTLFAPTNAAFAEIGSADLADLLADLDSLTQLLLLHVVAGVVLSGDLECTETIQTLQGQSTRTVCSNTVGVFQKGAGNSRSNLPEIISTDILACNGVIQVIDGVLIPGDHELA